ncbi:hypothetical protein [Stackebrandtia nassauensis]|uniref:Uncharacterized protein n=1 Tax=Stackebrandtia nassauensis (strain DSM 44728 / CIP 108903 / NRRL B-16338 / NBRC 102104 / LLR-40K-21) TaxID=446470 RepID=D3PVD1_STANL|nr:hypothetical protein [Stackebrandtia nassauensis]ADD41184.1 hypothetical protein Snas_1480 [Stackebrandtia nassauensis DSM 44728]
MKILRIAAKAILGIGLATAIVVAIPSVASANEVEPRAKLSHSQATAKFRDAGITWSSSGNCSDRNNPTCTSFEQIRSETVAGVITLKSASGCAIRLTGGTETGHASGTYSHWNGYKVDFALSTCLNNYIQRFTYIGGSKWKSGSGNIYYKEGNHWDVLYYNCGGCR